MAILFFNPFFTSIKYGAYPGIQFSELDHDFRMIDGGADN